MIVTFCNNFLLVSENVRNETMYLYMPLMALNNYLKRINAKMLFFYTNRCPCWQVTNFGDPWIIFLLPVDKLHRVIDRLMTS